MEIQPIQSPRRYHGLDAARAIALFIGIFHHGIESMVSYARSDWVTQDSQSSLTLNILFYISHVFRMQAFFLMSGFFAHLLFHRAGPIDFIGNRAKRLAVPFILFWPLLFFIIWNIWVWGIQYVRHVPYDEAVNLLPTYMIWSHGIPFMHLWFLYFLILYCIGVVPARAIIDRIDSRGTIRQGIDRGLLYILTKRVGALALGIIMVGPMIGMTDWLGVDTSSSGLIPRIWPFTIYGLYFTLGWFLERQSFLLQSIEKFRWFNFCAGSVLILLVIVLSLLFSEPADPSDRKLILMGINSLYAFASITTVFAFVGLMLKLFSKPSPAIRFLSDGAYWGYLIHLPIVVFLQIIVAPLDWHWSLKLLVVMGPTCAVLFLTYNFLVRNTFIGHLLNGKKSPPIARAPVRAESVGQSR